MKPGLLFLLRVKLWDRIRNAMVNWLNTEKANIDLPPYDFRQLCYEIRPGDVVLVEGRSRVSEVIKLITQSPWTHSALYIGHLYEISDPLLQKQIQQYYHGDPQAALIIEALLGEGTVVHAINKYRHDHLRICRPSNITPKDAKKVIEYCINKLGSEYHVRQLLDLARFLFPYSLLPRRWRSSLFMHNLNTQEKDSATYTVCSSMIAEAFQEVQFPVLPVTEQLQNGKFNLYMRNSRMFTPKDFDYSPYFEIIKYPMYGFDHVAMYKKMPWNKEGIMCHAPGDCYLPDETVTSAIYPEGKLQHKINLLKFHGKHPTKFTFKHFITDKINSIFLWEEGVYPYINPNLKSEEMKK